MPDRRRKKQRSCIGQIGKLSLRTCRLVTSRRGSDNQADGADVTEFKVGSTKLHLSHEVGLCSNEAVVYSIPRSPNMKIDLEMVAGLEDRLDGESVPLLNSDIGLAVPDVRLQIRARSDGNRSIHVPQRKLTRQCESRKLFLDGQDRAIL